MTALQALQEALPFVPAKDPAHSEAHFKAFPGQYLPEACFQLLPEKFIRYDGENKTLL